MKHIYIIEHDFNDEPNTTYAVIDHKNGDLYKEALESLQESGEECAEEIVLKNINMVWQIPDEDVLAVAKNLLDFSSN
jgi:hypothetical protein